MTDKGIKLVCLGLLSVLFGACTKQDALLPNGIIQLGARTDNYSRSSINDLKGLASLGDRVGIYGVVTDKPDAASVILSEEWKSTPLMGNVRTTRIDANTGALSWDGAYAYPLEEEKYVKFCVYHPYAGVDVQGENYVEASKGASPILHFTLTGTEDVMWVNPVVGSRTIAASLLKFNHLLTQLRFRIVDDEGNFAGTSITKLSFNNVNTVSTLNLETGKLGGWGTPSSNIILPLSAPVAISGTTDSPLSLSGEVMLQPGQAMFNMTVTTDNKGAFPSVEIRPTNGEMNFAAGRSYLVTLKFRDRTPVALSVMVTPWVMDGYGEGTVE